MNHRKSHNAFSTHKAKRNFKTKFQFKRLKNGIVFFPFLSVIPKKWCWELHMRIATHVPFGAVTFAKYLPSPLQPLGKELLRTNKRRTVKSGEATTILVPDERQSEDSRNTRHTWNGIHLHRFCLFRKNHNAKWLLFVSSILPERNRHILMRYIWRSR